MKDLKNAIIVNGVAYTLSFTEAKKIAEILNIKKPLETVKETAKTSKTEIKTKSAITSTQKSNSEPKKSTRIVGSLEQSGAYVRTVKGAFLSSKARFAIKMSATETFGATKLGRGNKIYDTFAKEDKYVQIYQFKSAEDAVKFMDSQESRMNK